MAAMATRTGHFPGFTMHTLLKLLFWDGRPQCMFFDKYGIRMAAIACLFNVGNVGHRFGILAGKDIMFPVTVITIGRPLRPFHDHLGMEALQVFLLRLLVAGRTVHPFVCRLPSTLGMFIIFNMGMAIQAG
jgi:hypothetical protein